MQAALEDGKCVVIGLQSTGDARTVEAVAERAVDGELDDFVSGPKVSHVSALTCLLTANHSLHLQRSQASQTGV